VSESAFEMLFAHLKRILRLGRLRLRGRVVLSSSSCWQRSRKIFAGSAKLIARPPPKTDACLA